MHILEFNLSKNNKILITKSIWFFNLLKIIQKLINTSILNFIILLFLLPGCLSSNIKADRNSEIRDSYQSQSLTIIGVSPEIYREAIKQGEEATKELKKLKKDRSLNATAKRVLAEADEAKEQGNNKLYLEKIQEYRQILTDEPIKRAAEAYVLEGRVLFSQLQLEEAQNAIEQAIKLNPNNSEYLLIFADYLQWNGKYQKMLEVSQQAISIIKNQESRDEILIADGFSSIGKAYLLKGNYNLATNPLQKSLEIRKKELGEEHPDIADSLNSLAILYESQGRYSEAEILYLQALEISKKTLGEEHPDTAGSLNNLAILYESQGRYSETEPLYLQALEIRKKQLGEEHPDIADSLNNLAVFYDKQGRYEKAEIFYLQALKIYKKTLGKEHPDTVGSLNNLAVLYESQGRYSEAEILYLQALEISKKTLGEDHPNTINIKENYELLINSKNQKNHQKSN